MPLKLTLPSILLGMAVWFISCESSGPSSDRNSGNGQNNSQTSPSNTPLSGTAPCPTPQPDANRKITITAPCDGAKVAQRHFVEGIVSDSNAQVWVITHPMETADYWVEPRVTVREGGKWRVLCYHGEPGQHSAKPYEIMAIANAIEKLSEGQLFSNWPEAQSTSQVIEVVRQ